MTLEPWRRRITTVTLLVAMLWPARAHAAEPDPDPDPWFGRDKALHFAASGAIAAGGYAIGAAVLDARGHALIVGGALAAAAGIGKEVLDLAGAGDPSWRDLAWDGLGAVTGLAVAWAIDLVVRGVGEERPLLVLPASAPSPRSAGLQLGLSF